MRSTLAEAFSVTPGADKHERAHKAQRDFDASCSAWPELKAACVDTAHTAAAVEHERLTERLRDALDLIISVDLALGDLARRMPAEPTPALLFRAHARELQRDDTVLCPLMASGSADRMLDCERCKLGPWGVRDGRPCYETAGPR